VAAWFVLGFAWWELAEWRTPGTLWYMAIDNDVLNVLRARRFPDEDVPLGALTFLFVAVLCARCFFTRPPSEGFERGAGALPGLAHRQRRAVLTVLRSGHGR
jgi:hypothetical protein